MNGLNVSWIVAKLRDRHGLPKDLKGETASRQNNCSFCNNAEGERLYRLDYWDIKEMWLVKCPTCRLMQVDPMPTAQDLSLGCRAFFLMEKSELSRVEMRRTCVRNFRKGVAFGVELKRRGVRPGRSLEIGAGDAYFSRGLKSVFADLEVSCLDVVPEVLDDIRRHHGFETILSTPEHLSRASHGGFDLIIARDILEHVTNPNVVLDRVAELLNPGGVFHFITPNGHEDIWRGYANWRTRAVPSQLLINHLNYFDPRGLRAELERRGLKPDAWVLYDFKGYRKGKGRRVDPEVTADVSTKRSAQTYLDRVDARDAVLSDEDRAEVLRRWWVRWPRVGEVYCALRHAPGLVCDADLGVGHEIHGVFRRQ